MFSDFGVRWKKTGMAAVSSFRVCTQSKFVLSAFIPDFTVLEGARKEVFSGFGSFP